ncbi:hypothetical protein AAC387_Pa11g1701 [Persea americana]
MTTKRAYKLQEFVAHTSSVNCLRIGRKSSRVLVTGGEDHKVNLWAIGKPNALLSLSGHTSAVESVSFDSSEVLVAAGAASGTIKLWDLEEAKIVRTLTGHRSNCISVDFHPFGEFFASGSLDTNLKIWDIRRKGCLHTYKGHTSGVNAIKFTPDGRWVVSGGEDNTVKLWDLTAGKLLHEFKCHEGQIQCIDFHPHEFLMATGSADRTVKFWDLETFELIGSAGPEATGVRSMAFNSDGRTLLCGLHENLKVLTWEPVRCLDTVDVGWSKLSDLNVHDGKLLGCSYNQSCVGVWVVDISRIEPYSIARVPRSINHCESLSPQTDNSIKTSLGRLSISQNSDSALKEARPVASTGSLPTTTQRVTLSTGPKATATSSAAGSGAITLKRSSSKTQSTMNIQTFNKADIIPIVVPKTSGRMEQAHDFRKETVTTGRIMPFAVQSKANESRKLSSGRDDSERANISVQARSGGQKSDGLNEVSGQKFLSGISGMNQPISATERNMADIISVRTVKRESNVLTEQRGSFRSENYDTRVNKPNRDASSVEVPKGVRTHSLVTNMEKRERSTCEDPAPTKSEILSSANRISFNARALHPSSQKETVSASDEDAIADVMEQHDQFLASMQSHLLKLQIIRRFWERNDIKGAINAMRKMSDHAVIADVVSIMVEKSDIITLDICTCLLPLVTSLLESKMDRHVGISLDMLLKLVRIFGPVIHSTVSASPSVGVDLQGEQRLERCNLCFIELEKVKHCLPSISRRGGSITKSAQELNLALQEIL